MTKCSFEVNVGPECVRNKLQVGLFKCRLQGCFIKKMVIIGKLCVESSKIDKQITDRDVS